MSSNGLHHLLHRFRDKMFNSQEDSSVKGKTVNSFVVLGVIGGMLRIYYSATMLIGRCLLILLKRLKRKEQERLRQHVEDRTLVELSGIGVSIVNEDESSPIMHRRASHNDLKNIVGFKPTLMADIFN
jgi:hypothetical protein